ncbi:carboxypeptidase M32 [Candidatus Fermentibacteria bacterium]|nr:carboxypeptidase M32 [Candidatus Fermentibacteria bacterium]
MREKLAELKRLLGEVSDLNAAAAVLYWDQVTQMPPQGASARGRQSATLSRLSHQLLTSPQVGRLLDELAPYGETLPHDCDEASLLRVARRDWDRATKVPSSFIAELSAHQSETYEVWSRAKEAADFPRVAEHLKRTVELSRRLAGFFPGFDHIVDPLIEEHDPGMTVATLRPLFAELRMGLAPLVERIAACDPADEACLHLGYPRAEQAAFCTFLQKRIGYDFSRGRREISPHPFTISFGVNDVRLTVRIREDDLGEALFAAIHETGHALYEMGVSPDLDGGLLAGGVSSGMHESQSRLWENIVGRSRPFWAFFYPRLQGAFPGQLDDVALETFYRAINAVRPSLIRTEADELTYNLHVMIRFDLECQLLEGSLSVLDLPDAWNARYEQDLGVTPPSDREGVLQDVHWFGGIVGGAFQGYTLGNVMAAQIHGAALAAHPNIEHDMEHGRCDTLLGWLGEHIYRHGRKFQPEELIRRATGAPLSVRPYMRYLATKYGELYNVGDLAVPGPSS